MSVGDIESLLAAVQDDRYEVWAPASLALLRLHEPAAVPRLLAALAVPNQRLRCPVATVLGEIGDQRAVEPLIALLRDGACEVVWENERARAAEALGQLGDPRAVEPLIAALAAENAETASKAMEALGRLGDRRAVEPLITTTRARHDPSGATILGSLGDRRAVEPLLEDLAALGAPHPDLYDEWSLEELEAFHHMRAGPHRDGWPWQASYYYYAIRALGKLGDPRAVPLLEWIRDHETAPVLKGKSLADVAVKALERIAAQAGDV